MLSVSKTDILSALKFILSKFKVSTSLNFHSKRLSRLKLALHSPKTCSFDLVDCKICIGSKSQFRASIAPINLLESNQMAHITAIRVFQIHSISSVVELTTVVPTLKNSCALGTAQSAK